MKQPNNGVDVLNRVEKGLSVLRKLDINHQRSQKLSQIPIVCSEVVGREQAKVEIAAVDRSGC